MRLQRWLALMLAGATGCSSSTRSARPIQIASRASELLRVGHADVPAIDSNPARIGGTIRVSADERVQIRIIEPDGSQQTSQLTVRELVAGCVDDLTAPGCLPSRAADEAVVSRPVSRLEGNRAGPIIGLSAIGALAIVCLAACAGGTDNGSEIGKGLKTTSLVSLAVVGGFILFFALAGGG